jgi:integrase/recombinase XerD
MAKTTRNSCRRQRRKPAFKATPEGYLAYKKQPGKRFPDSTSDKYLPQIRAYDRYCREHKIPFAEQDELFIEQEWFVVADELFFERYKRQPSASYVRNRYCALKSYFKFLTKIRAVPDNPLERIDAPVTDYGEVDWLTKAEDEALAAAEMDPLEEVLWALTRIGGLRISEVPYLLDEDVDLILGEIHVCDGKTRAAKRDVQMLPRLYSAVQRWRVYRDEIYGKPAPGASFIRTGRTSQTEMSDRPRHISTVYIDRIIKRIATRAQVRLHRDENGDPIALDKAGHNTSAVSAHTLRRTYGSDLLNRGVPIEVISEQLGHARTAVTEAAYARLLKRTVRQRVLSSVTGGVAAGDSAAAAIKRLFRADAASKQQTKKSRQQQLKQLELLAASIERQKLALLAA